MIGMVKEDHTLESKISFEWVVRLAYTVGFHSTLIQMDLEETDEIHPYPKLSKTLTLKEEWEIQSSGYAKTLLLHSNYKENLIDD